MQASLPEHGATIINDVGSIAILFSAAVWDEESYPGRSWYVRRRYKLGRLITGMGLSAGGSVVRRLPISWDV